jgi:hypothetical protein
VPSAYRSTSTRRLTSTSLCNLCFHLQSHLPSQLTLPRTSMCLRVRGRHRRQSERRRRIRRRCRYVFSICTSLRLCSCAFLHCSFLRLYSALYAAVHSKYRQILTHLCRSHAGRSRTTGSCSRMRTGPGSRGPVCCRHFLRVIWCELLDPCSDTRIPSHTRSQKPRRG